MRESGCKEPVVKLEPLYKDYLWGGNNLKAMFGKESSRDIAESWELSAHSEGVSKIAEGEFAGKDFTEYLDIVGRSALGTNVYRYEKFPILIKFIDAAKLLSIQVHPDDLYALQVEGEYGKNEMWYVVDAQPGAYLYYGLSHPVTKQELKERIENNTLKEVLNKVPVQPGDALFVKAGIIHAIGKGVIICEIQQNSNLTYRIDDYGRKDKNGEPRELHIDKALESTDIDLNVTLAKIGPTKSSGREKKENRLVESIYFTVDLIKNEDVFDVPVSKASFVAMVFIKGEGILKTGDTGVEHAFKAGDTFFVNAGERIVSVKGKSEFLTVRI